MLRGVFGRAKLLENPFEIAEFRRGVVELLA